MKTSKLIAILFLLLCVTGCSLVPTTNQPDEPTQPTVDALKYRSEYRTSLQYKHLSDEEQDCYDVLYTTIKDAINTASVIKTEDGSKHPGVRITFDTALSKNSMSLLYESFLKDNPQFFFLDRTYNLEGHQEDGISVYDTLILQFTLDQRERKQAIRQLDEKVEEILSERPDTDDDYITEKYFHDYLLAHCTYDEVAAEYGSSTHENAYSAYGALVEGWAVCEGYAKAMQLLLNKVSIPATVVMGRSVDDGESHMWNLVRINGSYYHLDATWDDNDEIPQYTYFNVTDNAVQRTHLPDDDQLVQIACNDTDDNFFVRNGTYCASSDREDIAAMIAKRVKAGDTVIPIQFTPGKYENALLFLKNIQQAQEKINNQLSNRKTMWDYKLHTNAKQYVIILVKSD